VLKKAKPKWIVAAELTETTKLYGRCGGINRAAMVGKNSRRFVQEALFRPALGETTGAGHAFERVTLYGLTVISKRRVHYGAINPKEAREIFIRTALVAGEYETQAPFFEHNRNLIAAVEELEHKARRQECIGR